MAFADKESKHLALSGVAPKRYGALEVWCRCDDTEVSRCGDAPQAYRCGGVFLKSSGALEARCRRRDVEVCLKNSGALEACCGRRDVGV